MPMKKSSLITSVVFAAGLLTNQALFAQKFLQKIKEKAQAATESLNGTSSSRPTKALYEKQQADAAKTSVQPLNNPVLTQHSAMAPIMDSMPNIHW